MVEKLQTYLASHGYKSTPPRLLVFKYLTAHDLAIADDLIAQLGDQVDRASIYRALKLFRGLNIIHDTVVGRKRFIELTDTFDIHHHHISCLECGYTKVIEDKGIERRLDARAQAEGFHEPAHQISISGICADCYRKVRRADSQSLTKLTGGR